eukprot:SAG31_NODE_1042_length_10187_cov_54.452121_5_plen_96_part_00
MVQLGTRLLQALLDAVSKFNRQLDAQYYLGSVGAASTSRYWEVLHLLLREALGYTQPGPHCPTDDHNSICIIGSRLSRRSQVHKLRLFDTLAGLV